MSTLLTLKSLKVPENWDLVPVGTVLLDSQYGTNAPTIQSGSLSVVGMKDIQDGKITTTNLTKTDLPESEKQKYLLRNGDVLLNRTNSYDLVGKIGMYCSDEEAVFASYLVRLNVNKNLAVPEYLNYWLNSYKAQTTIKKIATRAVSQANINPTEFKKHCFVALPPLPEQTAIAGLLSTWDASIEKTGKLIAAKEKRFLWLLSRLISDKRHPRGHIRDFATEVSTRNRDEAISQVLSVTNHSGFVLPEDQFERRVASSDLSNYKVVRRGQYAYNPSRINVGSIARLYDWEEGVLSPMYVVFEIDEEKVDSDFFLHWLSSHEAKQRIKNSAQGSVRETVSFGDFAAIPFPQPPLDKQREIAEMLNTARKEIDLLKTLADFYRQQKRGLMQKLLTGRWRVTS